MNYPLTVTFHNTRRSIRVEEEVAEFAERLDKFHDRIQSCEVVIDKPHRQHNKGNEFHVRILLSVPGQKLVVSSPTPKHGDHTSLHTAMRDAFEAAQRKLRSHRQKPRDRRLKAAAKENGGSEGGFVPAPA